ncbi:CHAD domain-containing protein [Paraburkholderia sp. DHOC27]|uniref:CHAD domain-containing protein n=1 Tax=Paraburkholderia sp. DHOC27 TaxID=2303330 RepID=UPI000E3CDEE3|nr:CHAD domain-containing protein [Paraburkholderia sp. DHOC27]RFU44494.1 CHAD domain-containing protein [Paraburkholderia sp. DHOC27]
MKPENSSVPASDTAEAHFTTFATPLIEVAVAHAAALQENADAEVLHKLRVALRRLRSLLWAYRPLLDKALDDRQRNLLKGLAQAAGQTRDWDILIGLLCELGDDKAPLDKLRAARVEASNKSRAILSHAAIGSQLDDALRSAQATLDISRRNTSLKQFAKKRLRSAEKSLRKRMRRASHGSRSNYEAYHEVRKAGKKMRYLLDFFEPMLARKHHKSVKKLKRIQKRFGALNDVVASEGLLAENRSLFDRERDARQALKALEKERRHRVQAAAKLL